MWLNRWLHEWRSSIRRQLVLGFGASTLLLMLVSGLVLYQQQRVVLYHQNIEHALSLANALAKSSTSWMLANDLAGLQEVVSGSLGTMDLQRAFVVSPRGEVLASTKRGEIGLFVHDEISIRLLKSVLAQSQVLVDQSDMLDIAVPIVAGHQILGWVRVELTRQTVNADLKHIIYFLLGFELLAAVLVSLTARALASGLLKELNQLMRVASEVRQGRHEIRADMTREDELGILARDVNQMLDTLCESELRFRQLTENIHEVFWMSTPDKREILYASPAYEQVWGRTLTALMDAPDDWLKAVHSEDRDRVERAMFTKQIEGLYNEEYRILRPDGEVRWIHDRAFPVRNAQGEIYRLVGVAEDITERKHSLSQLKISEERFDFLAHHDPLTRLPNRLMMNSRLDCAIDFAAHNHQKLALLVIDLDRFKNVNDSFGHAMGDELLQQVAARLSSRLRGEDSLTRLGGDEFTVLLENIVQAENAAKVALDLINALCEPWWLSNGVEVSIGASVGISLFPDHGNTAAELFQHADVALYQAKEEGRGRFKHFSEEMTHNVRERIGLESRLREALERKDLRVYYQPQIDTLTGEIVGAEALVRWQDSPHGLVSPSQFIPIAEESGLIDRIGEFVLRETCEQGQRWLLAGYAPLMLAVNLSPRQTQHSDVTALVSHLLEQTGFPAPWLELELTESALMKHEGTAIAMLNDLRALGVRLAIDDFGTGYSSLAYLKRFPLDVLKVDKSFIDDIPNQADGMALVVTIINMGHTLGFKVLAEGVENLKQLDFLKQHHCDFYQGYLTSQPLPAEAFEHAFLCTREGNVIERGAESVCANVLAKTSQPDDLLS